MENLPKAFWLLQDESRQFVSEKEDLEEHEDVLCSGVGRDRWQMWLADNQRRLAENQHKMQNLLLALHSKPTVVRVSMPMLRRSL